MPAPLRAREVALKVRRVRSLRGALLVLDSTPIAIAGAHSKLLDWQTADHCREALE